MTKKICSVPWFELYVNTLGNFGMCCVEDPRYNQSKSTVEQPVQLHWNSDYMKKSRRDFLDGNPLPQCQVCWTDEDAGQISMRHRRNLKYLGSAEISDHDVITKSTAADGSTDLPPMSLHFSVGTTCQLRCIECSPSFSRSILKDYQKLNWNENFKTRRSFDWYTQHLDQANLDLHLWPMLKDHAPQARWLQITGGEPTISRPLHEFLQWLCDRDLAKNLTISMTTNAVNIKPAFIELLKQFRQVIAVISIDGYRELDEYIRYPTNWEKKEQIVRELMRLFPSSSINTAVTSLNARRMPELIEWCWDRGYLHHLQIVTSPDDLSMRHMPKDIKSHIVSALDQTLSKINAQHTPDLDNYYDKGKFLESSIVSMQRYLALEGKDTQWKNCLEIVRSYDKIRPRTLGSIDDYFANI